MTNNPIARIFLILLGVATAALGVLYAVAPNVITDPTGFGPLTPTATTDIRATYGGLQLGLGIFLLWAASKPTRYRAGLVALCFMVPGLALSRFLGLLVDGDVKPLMWGVLAFEVVLSVVSVAILRTTDDYNKGFGDRTPTL